MLLTKEALYGRAISVLKIGESGTSAVRKIKGGMIPGVLPRR